MSENAEKLDLILDVEAGEDAEERDELTQLLRAELLELDVDRVDQVRGEEAPSGTRGAGVVEIGQLVVTLAQSATAIGALIGTVQSWLRRREGGTVKLVSPAGGSIEITGDLSPEQKELVRAFVEQYGQSGHGR
jgi:Effector Associated Constant Component 1